MLLPGWVRKIICVVLHNREPTVCFVCSDMDRPGANRKKVDRSSRRRVSITVCLQVTENTDPDSRSADPHHGAGPQTSLRTGPWTMQTTPKKYENNKIMISLMGCLIDYSCW